MEHTESFKRQPLSNTDIRVFFQADTDGLFSMQVTGSRLHELEQERLQMQEERELLSRQQDAMREHAGPRELRMYPRISLLKIYTDF